MDEKRPTRKDNNMNMVITQKKLSFNYRQILVKMDTKKATLR
ncbi:hypothetical protein ED5_0512 [Enterobacter roggenkampii]|nr:hypothetical protein ED5_0512 [Enterobacter roggenkampii]